ncbi:hypothetical protein Cgig2_010264 [Carnegiea gigantea]|uniref:Uncharacterized protein n=1 Tax=Carnegiea gigantea TaxID=171969 RepID=A0A9Q1KE10_9CARY|nr:hypothetical protein Cgig2_010264 [Carnegiea gigantea]
MVSSTAASSRVDIKGRKYEIDRSLIVFANNHQEGINQSAEDIVATSLAFKYKKFDLYDDALKSYKENQSLIYASDESLICFAKGASEPFQLIAKVLCNDRAKEYNKTPITQDAAASAYQIMNTPLNMALQFKLTYLNGRDYFIRKRASKNHGVGIDVVTVFSGNIAKKSSVKGFSWKAKGIAELNSRNT